MTSTSVYLISGANRGIGFGLVKQLVARDNVIVFAGARNPSTADDLNALAHKYPGKLHIVKLISSDKDTNETAAADIERIAGKLDVVIANAGINQYIGPILETSPEQMNNHFNINAIGPLVLFQAIYPLLKESSSPKFIVVSSSVGSIEDRTQLPGMLAYGSSKAAANYLARKIHFEYPDIVAFPICPGPVETDMSDFGKIHFPGLKDLPFITVDVSSSLVLEQIDNATRESGSGEFLKHNGSRAKW